MLVVEVAATLFACWIAFDTCTI